MSVTRYESLRRNGGFTPVYFINYGSIEPKVGDPSQNPADYVAFARNLGRGDDLQVHYLLMDGQIFRVFIKGVNWKLKSLIPIGHAQPDIFGQIFPKEEGLTESQINRSVRKTLKDLLQ